MRPSCADRIRPDALMSFPAGQRRRCAMGDL